MVFELFDSLSAKVEIVHTIVDRYHREIVTNNEPVQAVESDLCGQFATYYCLHQLAALNEPIGEILEDCFTRDLLANETLVKSFLADVLDEAAAVHD